jgi:hypothetical protein
LAKKRRKPRPRRPPAAAATATTTPAPAKPARAARTPRGSIDDERPPAPWGSFPLIEIIVLIALVMLGVGLFMGGSRGPVLLVTGLALGSLAGLELSIREHFAGYRSHTMLLAGAAGIAVLAFLFYAVPGAMAPGLRFAVAGAVAVAVGYVLARAFRARAGRMIKLR